MTIIEVLQEKLLGNFYSLFRVGSAFDLYFDDFWLIAHDVISSDEDDLNKRLLNGYQPAAEAIDKEDVAKSIVLSATFQKKITNVELNLDSSLELTFENGVKLLFPTNTEVVDWQWALNKNAHDPYLGFIVGVFESGEAQLGNC
ncbi:hypothetical protein [Thalassolituus alkanivorans]|uniref:hypothetical protein n=1 Tax=Thalassolituus alkanivorans TaxID=2881055 RepID=UPI001E466C10|nr:hypothetical protein [Thalassolituus alkanivorans]MCB2386850.1 hypothetical protein [Thalassolituus alkanivorans]MCB2425009.1 hypothetical protein [Thalassolituus alkanivorans]